MKNKKESFIEKSNKKHNNKYDYSKVEYINSQRKVCIICPEHGEFWQTPVAHVRGHGCPICSNKRRGKRTVNTENLIKKCMKVHNNKYTYENTEYINADTKICVTCSVHGDFYILPFHHLNGQGCPKCSGKNLTQDEVITKFKEIHKDKYDYSKVIFNKMKEKVCIICPEHGEFWQTPQKHLNGQGCPKCGIKKRTENSVLDIKTFINRANIVHSNKYDYNSVNFKNLHDKIQIRCPKHGYFEQNAYDHLNGHGCPICGQQISNVENKITEFIKELGLTVKTRVRNIIYPYELDIFIPSKNIAIEFNGLRWHSEQFKEDKNYHLNKTELCEKQNIKLFHIFEDEWIEHSEKVKSKLSQIFNYNKDLPNIYARKCNIQRIDNKLGCDFLVKNHIQGFSRSSIYLGCYYNDELVGVMTFKRERKDSDKWELTRFATDITKHCVGVGGKLFKYFVRNYNPSEVKSFADRRWTLDKDNNLYTKLGFKLVEVLKPDYKYIIENTNKRFHKFNFRKQILHKKYGLPLTMTENEMCNQIKAHKIWDCGLYKYIWKKEDF